MKLDNIRLMKTANFKRLPIISFHLYESSKKGRCVETKSKLVVGFLGRGIEVGINCMLAQGNFGGD